jgi:hypothetical protein
MDRTGATRTIRAFNNESWEIHMKKFITTATIAAATSVGALAAEAANVTVVNTGAQPVPVVGTVEVLATPPVSIGAWTGGCNLATGAVTCTAPISKTAPAGMVFRVTSVSAIASSGCVPNMIMSAQLSGQITIPFGAQLNYLVLSGVHIPSPWPAPSGSSRTIMNWSGNAYFNRINDITFTMPVPGSCALNATPHGKVSINYVIEPQLPL